MQKSKTNLLTSTNTKYKKWTEKKAENVVKKTAHTWKTEERERVVMLKLKLH